MRAHHTQQQQQQRGLSAGSCSSLVERSKDGCCGRDPRWDQTDCGFCQRFPHSLRYGGGRAGPGGGAGEGAGSGGGGVSFRGRNPSLSVARSADRPRDLMARRRPINCYFPSDCGPTLRRAVALKLHNFTPRKDLANIRRQDNASYK